ncbi:PorV/PorQ family protein [bacterium]|nr:PorV/PorQ family protein [bacterium]
MKKLPAFLLTVLIICLLATGGHAEFSKVGTSVAQFLKIPAGARAAALGGAYVAATEDVYSMAWNPAGLGRVSQYSLGGTLKKYIADLNYGFMGVAIPIDGQSTLGFGATFINSDPIEITTIEQPNGTGTTYDYSGMVLGLTYARWLTDRLTVGATVKMVRESIFRETAQAFAFDLGSQFDTGIYGIRLAMCVSNFGSKMRMDGPDLNTISDINGTLQGNRETESRMKTLDWPLPMMFRMGIMVDVLGPASEIIQNSQHRMTLLLDANDAVDNVLRGNAGIEYNWNKLLSLRGGYYINYDNDTAGITAGAGLNFTVGSSLLGLDYAYQDFGILDSVHQYSLTLYF